MKKSVFHIALFLGLLLSQTAISQEKISLRVPNFVRPLVEKWASDYQKSHTNVDFQFVSGKSQDNNHTLSLTIVQSVTSQSLATDAETVSFARFAVLPVTTKNSEADHLTASHRLNAKKLRSLFFVKDELDETREETKAEQHVHIYTGNSQQSASRLYASYLKQETANYKGKKISGDDSFLTTAISRDPLGVTINSLSNIFDIDNRQLKASLTLLPLDIDKQGRQTLESGRLDDIITLLEHSHYDVIPVGRVGFAYNHSNTAINDFVGWILTTGVNDLHHYGLLSLTQKELAAQKQRVVNNDLAQK